MASTPLNDTETRSVRRLAAWRWAYWMSFVLALPAFGVAVRGIGDHRSWHVAGFPVAVLVLFGWSAHRINRFRCPRCGALFFDQQGPLGPSGTTLPPISTCVSCEWSYRSAT